MDLVINEWFAEYCRVEETNENKQLLKMFLEKFLQKADVIYVRQPSAFLNKIFSYAKQYQSHRDTYSISVITFFIKTILQNSDRCIFVDGPCVLDQIIVKKLEEENLGLKAELALFLIEIEQEKEEKPKKRRILFG